MDGLKLIIDTLTLKLKVNRIILSTLVHSLTNDFHERFVGASKENTMDGRELRLCSSIHDGIV